MLSKENTNLIQRLARQCLNRDISLVTAESCTGGLLSSLLTQEAGSSKWFDRGFVTYSNNSKIDSLGVQGETLENFGAVSQEVANEMSKGALKNSEANISVSITGIAGPEGGSFNKPVGLIYVGLKFHGKIKIIKKKFKGSRLQIQKECVNFIFNYLDILI